MKYYIYISETKVDMLFPQVPHEIKAKTATEFKIDLKLLSASRSRETESEENQIARLETVLEFIRQYGNVGSVDEPEEYVEDQMILRWGDYDGAFDKPSPIVFFGGETDKTIVGLAGSMKHVLGRNVGDSASHSHSATPYLKNFLIKELEITSDDPRYRRLDAVKLRELYGRELSVLDAVHLASPQMFGDGQDLEFLAKKLAFGEVTYRAFEPESPLNKKVLLATHLYVAMA